LNKPVIGLTGPTGAGKSTVAQIFRELGCAVIDADLLAREVVQDPCCLKALCSEFGADIVTSDGKLDRHLLAKRAFSSPDHTERLNRITHPAIGRETVQRIEKLQDTGVRAIILDAPLLFESGSGAFCKATIAVTAPLEIRLERIIKRDGITEEAAKERMNAQHSNEFYEHQAEYILNGCMERSELREEASHLLKQILGEKHEVS
jgi:dephospho-CoA kinase